MTESPVTYLAAGRIIGASRQPYNHGRHVNTMTTYGRKLATDMQVKLDDKRTRRVYAMNYGNSPSIYVLVAAKELFLDVYCQERLELLVPHGIDCDWRSFDDFTTAYMEASLWSSNDESDESGGKPLDQNYTLEDIEQESRASILAECHHFQEINKDDLETCCERRTDYNYSRAGHDFWLTRNGHGAGFWDRGLPDDIGDKLTESSKAFGNIDPYIGDNGKIYIR